MTCIKTAALAASISLALIGAASAQGSFSGKSGPGEGTIPESGSSVPATTGTTMGTMPNTTGTTGTVTTMPMQEPNNGSPNSPNAQRPAGAPTR